MNAFSKDLGSQTYIDLSGLWQFASDINPEGFDPNDVTWKKIKVPSNWYEQGHDFHGWAAYRTSFSLPIGWQSHGVQLIFNGVDYQTKAFVNGEAVGEHEGYFQPFGFDISDHLHKKGENELLVLVNAPLEDPDGKLGKDWSLHKTQVKGILNHHDTRPGGAWGQGGQDRSTGGIWAPVTLKKYQCLGILHQRVTSYKNKVEIDLQVGADGWKNVVLDTRIVPANFKGKTYHHRSTLRLKPGYNEARVKIVTPEPKLWWPYDLGKPNLYHAVTTLSVDNRQRRILPAGVGGDLPFGGSCRDVSKVRFGYRTIAWSNKLKGWLVNGKRLFQRGTNYIGGVHLASLNKKIFQRDIKLMKGAHINTVRVHAHVTAKEFYEVADEEGVLVWQDFPLQWGYEDSEEFQLKALDQVRDMVHGFYNHPSIVAWQIHNEPPWDAWWMDYKYKTYDAKQNKKLDKVLYDRVKSLDKTRIIHKASTNDEHPWYGWYSKHFEDYHKPIKEKLVSEFGAQGLPSKAILKNFLKPSELWPLTETNLKKWEYHNFQPRETFEIAGVEKGKNLNEFIKNSQTYQAHSIKAAAEGLRLQRYSPVAGAFQFMFNEHWESVNWGVMDYKRKAKPSYDALKKGFQPTTAIISPYIYGGMKHIPNQVSVHIINDQHRIFEKASIEIVMHPSGIQKKQKAPVWSKVIQLDIDQDASVPVINIDLSAVDHGSYDIEMVVSDASGKVISTNSYSFIQKQSVGKIANGTGAEKEKSKAL